MTVPFLEENDQTVARREHLEALRQLVGNVYPNKFERSNVTDTPSGEDTITSIRRKFKNREPDLRKFEPGLPSSDYLDRVNGELNKTRVRVAGRMTAPPRLMGGAAFFHLTDGESRLQVYVKKNEVKGINNSHECSTNSSPLPQPGDESGYVEGWRLFRLLDQGDFVGVEGFLFITRAGELTVHAELIQFLSKALLPMPSKIQGISNPETRQRQRYADLIAGSLRVEAKSAVPHDTDLDSRQVFELRSKVVKAIRSFLDRHDFVEVETPMLTSLATGAAARPFKTRHNALNIDLYARIAPELYLKRLLVGGFERVYELNRNFRNEGIDRQHNPEFTMLEFYVAYADVNQMMDLFEEMLRSIVRRATRKQWVRYGNHEINFSEPFERLTMKEAIIRYWPQKYRQLDDEAFVPSWLDEPWRLYLLAKFLADVEINKFWNLDADAESSESAYVQKTWLKSKQNVAKLMQNQAMLPPENIGQRLADIFETVAEPHLIKPTFITDFPKPISPLSKASPSDPSVAERFEYFVGGLESANGFSELNDPEEQYQRFKEQAQQRERGDEEAMVMDEDYIRALAYGMPPAAGIGVGIDRLVMLLANKHSIRDVILFPHMRPERTEGSRQEADGRKDTDTETR
jgi:lysyl-tRNA synthetase class 2